MRRVLMAARGGVVVFGALAAAASATAPTRHKVRNSVTVQTDFAGAWSAVIDLFATNNWPIKTIERDSGIIATEWATVSDTYADCGEASLASTISTQVRFSVRVKETDEGTKVAVHATFRRLWEYGLTERRRDFAECTSLGTLEQIVHHDIVIRAREGRHEEPKAAAKPAEAAPRGFYCASSPTVATASACAREKRACEQARGLAAGAVADIGACVLVESAHCFDAGSGSETERCAATADSCEAQRDTALAGTPDTAIGDCAEEK